MLRTFCAALAVLALLPAWPALAKDDEEEQGEGEEAQEVDYNRTGAYLGLAGTWGVEEFQDTNDINIDDTVGVNGRVGYRALSWLSAELQAEYVPNWHIDFGSGSDDGNLDMWLVGGNLRWNLPTGLIQPYLLTGGGYMGADLSGTGNESGQDGNGAFARLGGGMEFYPWSFLALDFGIAYVLPTNDVDKLDFLSITWGALYRF
jgi:hypothetical protein